MQNATYATCGIIIMQELRKGPVKLAQLAEILSEAAAPQTIKPGYAQQFTQLLRAAGMITWKGGYVLVDPKRRYSAWEIMQVMSKAPKSPPARPKNRLEDIAAQIDGRIERTLRRVKADSL